MTTDVASGKVSRRLLSTVKVFLMEYFAGAANVTHRFLSKVFE